MQDTTVVMQMLLFLQQTAPVHRETTIHNVGCSPIYVISARGVDFRYGFGSHPEFQSCLEFQTRIDFRYLTRVEDILSIITAK